MAALHTKITPSICRACRTRKSEIWLRSFSSIPSRRLDIANLSTSKPDSTRDDLTRTSPPQNPSITRTESLKEPAVKSARRASAKTSTSTLSSPAAALLPYHVSRTPSNYLPVYHDTRNGGTRKETIIRKITGDARPLRDALRKLLNVDSERVWIGKVTGHVYVKGHHKTVIDQYLKEQGF